MRRVVLLLLVPACVEHGSGSDNQIPGEYDFGNCELFEPAPGAAPDCDALETITTACGARDLRFMPVGGAVWSQTHCKGIVHFGTPFSDAPSLAFGFAGAATYDIVEDDENDCPIGGVAPEILELAPRAEADDGDAVGTGTLVIETGGTAGARFTRGFADVSFDNGQRLVAKFIAPFCGFIE